MFNDLSNSEDDSHQGSSSKRGDDPNVTLATASEYSSAGTQRVNEVIEPFKFDNQPIMATVGPIQASHPSGSFLNENLSSCFKEFDILKLRNM